LIYFRTDESPGLRDPEGRDRARRGLRPVGAGGCAGRCVVARPAADSAPDGSDDDADDDADSDSDDAGDDSCDHVDPGNAADIIEAHAQA